MLSLSLLSSSVKLNSETVPWVALTSSLLSACNPGINKEHDEQEKISDANENSKTKKGL